MGTKPIKVEHLTGNLQTCSQINLVRTGRNKYELSIYTDLLSTKGITENVKRIKKAFPALGLGFYDLLTDRVKDGNFTDKRLNDAVNHVIDNCRYPKPSISDFVGFDKTVKMLNYAAMCKLSTEWGPKVWERYDKIKIDGRVYWYDKSSVNI